MDEEPRQTTWWGKWGVGTSTPTINRYSGSRQQAEAARTICEKGGGMILQVV